MFFSVKSYGVVSGLLSISLAVTAQAATIRVPADRPAIQAAINAAVNGDTVQVAAGTYYENLNFLGKAIRVTSEQGPQLTIIDGSQAGPVVSFISGETGQTALNGFTIRNGRASVAAAIRGGGIRIENSSPAITGNIITSNTAADGGGGISSSFGSPLIQRNTITNNGQTSGFSGGVGGGGVSIVGASSATLLNNSISGNSWASANGGGVSLFAAGTPLIQNNSITNNTAWSQGGGISIVNQSDVSIVQNIIAGNKAATGGGVYWLVPSGARGPLLVNNTISANGSPQGSGVFADGFDAQAQLINNIIVAAAGQNAIVCGTFDKSIPSFQSNDVFAPSGSAYAGICGNQTGQNGNISGDPIFKNPATGDFHLLAGSPAIDAGTLTQAPQTDLDGIARPQDGNGDCVTAVDMGVYEIPGSDCIPPVTNAAATPPPNNAGWNKTNVTVNLSASDAGGSGVQAIRYWLSGAQTTPVIIGGNPASVAVTAEGATTVGYSAIDNAGNAEVSKSLTLKIDKTNPVIAGMPAPGCTLSPAKHQLVTAATVTASDAFSGVASLKVTAVSNEPDSGTGGGDLPGDIVITGTTVQLRAERSPSGKGRIYTITATAMDFAGNTATATATCSVPK